MIENADRVSTDFRVYRLSVTRLSFAMASIFAFVYAASVIIVMSGPQEVTIRFLNSILHGFDVTAIMRWEMPWWEMVVGVLEVFIIGWLCGAAMAIMYNLPARKAGP